MLGLYVMFIVSLHGTEPEELCAVAGGLLHYFMLVTFFMMGAEAINLYVKLVIVLGAPPILKNRYVLKSALISWSELTICQLVIAVYLFVCLFVLFVCIVVPIFIVVASEAPDWRNYVNSTL